MRDFTCDLDCPAKVLPGYSPNCCMNCAKTRGYWISDENRHLWDDVAGFWGLDGCKLERKDMPPECKAYDCKKSVYTMVVKRQYIDGKWWDIQAVILRNGVTVKVTEKGLYIWRR